MSRPHRLVASQYIGVNHHFLTICTYQRRREFTDADVVQLVCTHFLQQAEVDRFELVAYCFMPDHFHAIATGESDDSDLQRFVKLAKQKSGFAFTRRHRRRLWQESYFDRTLRAEEALPDVVRYLLNNPLRSGLVESPGEYLHWGSQRHTRKELLDFIATGCRV